MEVAFNHEYCLENELVGKPMKKYVYQIRNKYIYSYMEYIQHTYKMDVGMNGF